ncbi:pupal cuticle protein Edg-78E [Drosophila innubila]|uniref:pupal cuticle protein Edg-78E n=1 Tax=Drosophila innubila TaxID=198719 RepID=UPI00148BDAFA|nr:pupal cuticle protein Edg-78E [Drosophila innubila]
MNSRRRPNQRLFVKHQLFLLLLTLLLPAGEGRPATPDAAAQTIYYENQPPNASGKYKFEFQTTNGITTKAAGNENGAVGVVQYVSKEGLPVTFTYVADANGYQPTGDFAPTHLSRLLDYIQTHPKVDELKSRRW